MENGKPEVRTVNGRIYVVLNPAAKWSFGFGLSKARLIIEKLPFIVAYVKYVENHCVGRLEDYLPEGQSAGKPQEKM